MRKKKDTFIFRDRWLDKLLDMEPHEVVVVMDAIATRRHGVEPQLPQDRYVRGVIKDIFDQMDEDAASYDEVCQRRTEAIRKRWGTPPKDTNVSEPIQTKQNDSNNDNVSDNDSECDNDNDSDDIINDVIIIEEKKIEKKEKPKSESKTIPPTQEMVTAYIERQGIKDVDPITFWNYYESKGWMIGKTKMKDWHCAVATFQRQRYGHTTSKQQLAEESRRRLGEELIRRNAQPQHDNGPTLDLITGELH